MAEDFSQSPRKGTPPEKVDIFPLRNRIVALAESRDLDTLAMMLEEVGADVLRCPMVSILDAPDAAGIEAFLRELAGGAFTDLILLTGEGLRRLLGFARRAKTSGKLEHDVVAALAKLRKITRGPKPARALTEIGLHPDLPAATPTTQGIIAALADEAAAGTLRDRRIAVQLYGQEPNRPLAEFLQNAGAHVTTVAPYVYAPAADDRCVLSLIERMAGNEVSVIAFTSAAQVERLWELAEANEIIAKLLAGLRQTRVAALGPVVATELQRRGVKVDIMPQKNYFMRSLVKQIVAAFATQ